MGDDARFLDDLALATALSNSLVIDLFEQEKRDCTSRSVSPVPPVIVTANEGYSSIRGDGFCSVHAFMMAILTVIPLQDLTVRFEWLPCQKIRHFQDVICNLREMCDSVLNCRNKDDDVYIFYENVSLVACELKSFQEILLRNKNVSSIDGYSHMSLIAIMLGVNVDLVDRRNGYVVEVRPSQVKHDNIFIVSTNQCHWEAHANQLPVNYEEQWFNQMMRGREGCQPTKLMLKNIFEYDPQTKLP